MDPIRLEFTFDETAYLRYERLSSGGKDVTSREASVMVGLKLIDERDFAHRGYMDFVDNVIDRASGTIRARAQFSNPDGVFTPGMFARVRVPGSPAYAALMVPDGAILSEQARKYVLVVDGESVARQRYVTLGELVDGLRVIKEGLASDDRLIVNGLMRARPGVKVNAQEQAAAAHDRVPDHDPVGSVMSRHNRSAPDRLVPAKAGTQAAQGSSARTQPLSSSRKRGPITTKVSAIAGPATSPCCGVWVPACAGTTGESDCFTSGQSH